MIMIRSLIENYYHNNKPFNAGSKGMVRDNDWLLYYQ